MDFNILNLFYFLHDISLFFSCIFFHACTKYNYYCIRLPLSICDFKAKRKFPFSFLRTLYICSHTRTHAQMRVAVQGFLSERGICVLFSNYPYYTLGEPCFSLWPAISARVKSTGNPNGAARQAGPSLYRERAIYLMYGHPRGAHSRVGIGRKQTQTEHISPVVTPVQATQHIVPGMFQEYKIVEIVNSVIT